MVRRLILIRHGASEWNQSNLFCGWVDVDLSDLGRDEARKAATLLKAESLNPHYFYTSILKRSKNTLDIILNELGWENVQIKADWRLNERHYGALTGLNKAETAAKYGEDQVKIWRRSYDVPPPPLDESSPYYPGNSSTYDAVPRDRLPRCESLKDTVARVIPFWNEELKPRLTKGDVLIAGHGTSIRALVKIITDCPDDKIRQTEIPTGIPLIYEVQEPNMDFVSWRYLGTKSDYMASVAKNKAQGKAKKD